MIVTLISQWFMVHCALKRHHLQDKENSGRVIKLFLDALASLDPKLSLSEKVTFFTASASTGLSDYFLVKRR